MIRPDRPPPEDGQPASTARPGGASDASTEPLLLDALARFSAGNRRSPTSARATPAHPAERPVVHAAEPSAAHAAPAHAAGDRPPAHAAPAHAAGDRPPAHAAPIPAHAPRTPPAHADWSRRAALAVVTGCAPAPADAAPDRADPPDRRGPDAAAGRANPHDAVVDLRRIDRIHRPRPPWIPDVGTAAHADDRVVDLRPFDQDAPPSHARPLEIDLSDLDPGGLVIRDDPRPDPTPDGPPSYPTGHEDERRVARSRRAVRAQATMRRAELAERLHPRRMIETTGLRPVFRQRRWWQASVAALALGIGVPAAAIARPTALGGDTSWTIVVGHSMEPTLDPGDMVFTRAKDDYAVGDVIVYRIPEGTAGAGVKIIHRIVGGDAEEGFVTRGDNRDQNDPWRPTPDDITGEHSRHIDGAGGIVVWLRSPLAIAALLGLGAYVGTWQAYTDEQESENRPHGPRRVRGPGAGRGLIGAPA